MTPSLPFCALSDRSSPAAPAGRPCTVRSGHQPSRGPLDESSQVTSDADDPLLAPYRPVRQVGRGDAPWPGLLVRLESGDSRMLVDSEELPDGWSGWRADPEGHL